MGMMASGHYLYLCIGIARAYILKESPPSSSIEAMKIKLLEEANTRLLADNENLKTELANTHKQILKKIME